MFNHRFAAANHVRYWHIADQITRARDIRFSPKRTCSAPRRGAVGFPADPLVLDQISTAPIRRKEGAPVG